MKLIKKALKAKRACSLSTPHVCFAFNAQVNNNEQKWRASIWNDLHVAHISICMVVGLNSQDFNSTTKYIYRERGVQEDRVFLNTARTLMCERVRVCVCENIK